MPIGPFKNPWKFNLVNLETAAKNNRASEMAAFEDSVYSVNSGGFKDVKSPR
jgi:hypothetical protein